MLYKGSCHCGAVAFEVEGEIDGVADCNCSICARKGALLWAVPRNRLRLLTPEEAMSSYLFNKHVIAHRFCRVCGMHPYAESRGSEGEAEAYVNVRCLEGVDLGALTVIEFDGRAL